MALTVVGSIAFDAVKTPFGERERMLGGAATHFSLAASSFTEVRPVGPVGDDFGSEHFELLEARGIKTDDIERVAGGKSFFWRGHYDFDLNTAHTDDTQLGVFGEFEPKLSAAAQGADTLFLANIQPDLQRQVRAQCSGAGFSGLDSMNLWIDIAKDSLLAAIAEVDCVVLNDAEIRMLTAFPLEDVRDPTGAGDSFAGGFFGYLDGVDDDLDETNLRRAMGYGTVLASFNVEEFGTERVSRLDRAEIDERFETLRRMTQFEGLPAPRD